MTKDEITALFERRHEAFNEHEAAALAEDFSDDATVESPLAGGTAIGRARPALASNQRSKPSSQPLSRRRRFSWLMRWLRVSIEYMNCSGSSWSQ